MAAWLCDLTLEQWGLLISLVLTAGALYYAYRASRTSDRSLEVSEEALRVSEEQLDHARAEAEMRADIAVDIAGGEALELAEEPGEWAPPVSGLGISHGSPPRYRGPGPHADLQVELHNRGKTTANNVRAWLHLRSTDLRPVDPGDLQPRGVPYFAPGNTKDEDHSMSVDDTPEGGSYQVALHDESMPPGMYRKWSIPMVFVSPGDTEVSYSAVSDEGASARGKSRLRVPSLEEREDRLRPKPSGLTPSELEELKEATWEIITESWEADLFATSREVRDRLEERGADVPDYAMMEVIALLEDRVNAIPENRRTAAALREHGGMALLEPG